MQALERYTPCFHWETLFVASSSDFQNMAFEIHMRLFIGGGRPTPNPGSWSQIDCSFRNRPFSLAVYTVWNGDEIRVIREIRVWMTRGMRKSKGSRPSSAVRIKIVLTDIWSSNTRGLRWISGKLHLKVMDASPCIRYNPWRVIQS